MSTSTPLLEGAQPYSIMKGKLQDRLLQGLDGMGYQ